MNDFINEIKRCVGLYKDFGNGVLMHEQLHNGIYEQLLPDNYEKSYADPEYAKKLFGEKGGILSAVYADLLSIAPYAAEKNTAITDCFIELAKKMIKALENDTDKDGLIGIYRDFYVQNIELFVNDSLYKKFDIGRSYVKEIVEDSDLSDGSYLYGYGLFIGENEKRMSEYLNSFSEDEIYTMAHTLTEGFRIGFEVGRKDITKKRIVNVEFPIGMERMARTIGSEFRKISLEPTYSISGIISFSGRGGEKRGVFSTSLNRQFEFDHKNDMGFYLDMEFVKKRLELLEAAYESVKASAKAYAGPAVIECFGHADFKPKVKDENCEYSDKQHEALTYYSSKAGLLTNKYIPGDEYGFSIIAYPLPSIGDDFEAIFKETVKINTLDYTLYRDMQQKIIDLLDQGEYVRVKGAGSNTTDMKVMLHPLSDPEKETIFENCVADVNFPVGEVFTTPVLEGTNGVLNVSEVFLGVYSFKNLTLTFKDGVVTDFTCDNFDDEAENKKLIMESIFDHHEWLPIGEFAVGTNTTAFMMARKYRIAPKLPVLIAEKTGPHFAVGDTCYSFAEDLKVYNPDGKEIIARSNSFADKRNSEPDKAYFNCHTDITIPYDELSEITVVTHDGREFPIILNGRFVVPGTEILNKPLDEG